MMLILNLRNSVEAILHFMAVARPKEDQKGENEQSSINTLIRQAITIL